MIVGMLWAELVCGQRLSAQHFTSRIDMSVSIYLACLGDFFLLSHSEEHKEAESLK